MRKKGIRREGGKGREGRKKGDNDYYPHLRSLHPLFSILLFHPRPHPHISTFMLLSSTYLSFSFVLSSPQTHIHTHAPPIHFYSPDPPSFPSASYSNPPYLTCVIFPPLTHSLAGHASSLAPFFHSCIPILYFLSSAAPNHFTFSTPHNAHRIA